MVDAFTILREDHQRLTQLVQRIFRDRSDREALLKELQDELDDHRRLEETIFYPTCYRHVELRHLAVESYGDHDELKARSSELSQSPAGDQDAEGQLKQVLHRLLAHLRAEEEMIFPLAQKILRPGELDQLAQDLEERRRRFPLRHGRSHSLKSVPYSKG